MGVSWSIALQSTSAIPWAMKVPHGGDLGFVLLEEVLEVDGEVWAVGLVCSIFGFRMKRDSIFYRLFKRRCLFSQKKAMKI